MHPSQEKIKQKHAKNPKINKDATFPSEKERIYGIYRLNIGDPEVDL